MSLIVPGVAIVATYPVLQHLIDLKCGGWRFIPPEPQHEHLDGFHAWAGGWRDAIRFRDEDDAFAIRTDPDNRITWEFSGSLEEVVHELLLLPHPGDRLAPRLARGHGPG